MLSFAGVANPTFSVTPNEAIFAEKMHAYLHPWNDRINTRDKDIVDANLLIDRGMDKGKVCVAMEKVFQARELPESLPPPPAEWNKSYDKLADQVGLDRKLDEAYEKLNSFYKEIYERLQERQNERVIPSSKDAKDQVTPNRDAGLEFLLNAQAERSHRVRTDKDREAQPDLDKGNTDKELTIDDGCACKPEQFAVVVPLSVGEKLIEMERIEPETMLYLQEKFSELQEPRLVEHAKNELQIEEPLLDLKAAADHARQDMVPIRESSEPNRDSVITDQKERLGGEYEISYLEPRVHHFMVVSYRCEPSKGYYTYWSSVQVGWDRVTDRISTESVDRELPQGVQVIEHRTGDTIDRQQDFEMDR